jgi:hypothetical protein
MGSGRLRPPKAGTLASVAGYARTLGLAAIGLLVVLGSTPAAALKFRATTDSKIGRVLEVYDCGRLPSDGKCAEHEGHFTGPGDGYVGDARVLESFLAQQKFDEVWLISGGGDLEEGLALGAILRRYQTTVRVPKGGSCVSACTVAFMGGLFRFVDDGATYKVHAYSRVSGGLPNKLRDALLSNPERGLEQWAQIEHSESRKWARDLVVYFQRMINGRPERDRINAILAQTRQAPPYLTSGALALDAARIRAEGIPAAHEIAMAIERVSMQAALNDLRPHIAELGARAEHAIRMVDTMFTSRILGTASLSRETLEKFGYVTPIIQPLNQK